MMLSFANIYFLIITFIPYTIENDIKKNGIKKKKSVYDYF